MTIAADETVRERLEAEARVAMAKLPKPETCRGWLSSRARRDGLDWIDVLLDEYLALIK